MKTPTVLETPCREWQGSRNLKGYGKRYVRGSGRAGRRSELIHRWVWSQINGPVPAGMLILHRCDNPPCFRYDHLFLGTSADNTRDMVEKDRGEGQFKNGQTHCIHGHPFDEANTYYHHASDGRLHRQCKACKNERNRRRRARKQ